MDISVTNRPLVMEDILGYSHNFTPLSYVPVERFPGWCG